MDRLSRNVGKPPEERRFYLHRLGSLKSRLTKYRKAVSSAPALYPGVSHFESRSGNRASLLTGIRDLSDFPPGKYRLLS